MSARRGAMCRLATAAALLAATACHGAPSVNDLFRFPTTKAVAVQIAITLAEGAGGAKLADGVGQSLWLNASAADDDGVPVPLGVAGAAPAQDLPVFIAGASLSFPAVASVPASYAPGPGGYALHFTLSSAASAGRLSRATAPAATQLDALVGGVRAGTFAAANPVTLSVASSLAFQMVEGQGGSLATAATQAAYAQIASLLAARQVAVEASLAGAPVPSLDLYVAALTAGLKSQVAADLDLQAALGGVLVGEGAAASGPPVAPSAAAATEGLANVLATWGQAASEAFQATDGALAQVFTPTFAAAAQAAATGASAGSLAATAITFSDQDPNQTVGGTVTLRPARLQGGVAGYRIYLGGEGPAESRLALLGVAAMSRAPTLEVPVGTPVPAGATRLWAYPFGGGRELDAPASAPLADWLLSPPGAPSGVHARVGDGQVQLVWRPVAGATAYTLYRGAQPTSVGLRIASTAAPSYLDTGLVDGQALFYRVTASNAAGEGPPSKVHAATPQTLLMPPAQPTATPQRGQVVVAWAPVVGADGYVVRRAVDANVAPAPPVAYHLDQSPLIDADLEAGVPYLWTVSTLHGEAEGAPSVASTATLLPDADPPAHLSARVAGAGAALTWSSGPAAVSYTCLYLSQSSPVPLSGGTLVTGTQYQTGTLAPGAWYATATQRFVDGGLSGAADEEAFHIGALDLATGMGASFVIGQQTMTGLAAPIDTDGATVRGPLQGIAVSLDGHLFLSDAGFARVLGFAFVPASNHAAATFALGQASVTSASPPGLAPSALSAPGQLAAAGPRLVVADVPTPDSLGAATVDGDGPPGGVLRGRVLIFDPTPTASPAAAQIVLGAQAFGWASTQPPSARRFAGAPGVAVGGGRLLVVDHDAHRVLLYKDVPIASNMAADLAIGQPDLDASGPAPAPSASTLLLPSAAWTDGQRLLILDAGNNRVLVYNSLPTRSGAPADLVIGQTTMTQGAANGGALMPSAATLATSTVGPDLRPGLASNGTQIAVADAGNNRVLVWNAFPTASGAAADVVLGQSTFTDGDGQATAAASLSSPEGLYLDTERLIVGDSGDDRALVFTSAGPI